MMQAPGVCISPGLQEIFAPVLMTMSRKTVMIIIVTPDVDDEPEHDRPLVLLNHLLRVIPSPKLCIYINLGYSMEFYPSIGDKGGKKSQ